MRENIQGLGWYVRRTDDLPLLTAFYRDAVGLPVLQETESHVLFWGGETIAFELAKGGKPLPKYADRYEAPCAPLIRSLDVNITIDRVKKAGAQVLNDFHREVSQLTYFVDPKGNVTGINTRYRTSPRAEDIEAWRKVDAGELTVPGVPPMANELLHIGWVVLRSSNIPEQIAFYRDVIGLSVNSMNGDTGALLSLGSNTVLEIAGGPDPEPTPTDRMLVNNTFVLRVHGLDAMVAGLKAKGVPFVAEPFQITNGRVAYFADPGGHMVGLQERAADSPDPLDQEAARRWQNH